MPPKNEKRSNRGFAGHDDEESEAELFHKTRSQRTLFMKNLPPTTTEDEVYSLHPGIQRVKLDISKNNSKTKYALMDFIDEHSATDAIQQLQGVELCGYKLYLDHLETSAMISYNQSTALSATQDPLKLYVTGFGQNMTEGKLAAMFPTASTFTFNIDPTTQKSIGFAFVHFDEIEEAKKVHDSMQDVQFDGRSLVVMFAKVSSLTHGSKRSFTVKGEAQAPAKRARLDEADQAEADEEEDDDEDEEEDNEGDDDDDDEDNDEDYEPK